MDWIYEENPESSVRWFQFFRNSIEQVALYHSGSYADRAIEILSACGSVSSEDILRAMVDYARSIPSGVEA